MDSVDESASVDENVSVEKILAPSDDLGDWISALFRGGFSEEEIDLVVESTKEIYQKEKKNIDPSLEAEALAQKFYVNNFVLTDEKRSVFVDELERRLK